MIDLGNKLRVLSKETHDESVRLNESRAESATILVDIDLHCDTSEHS